MRRIAERWLQVNTDNGEEDVYIGLDVHKRSYSVALFSEGVIIKAWISPAKFDVLIRSLESYRQRIRGIVYEAGPTGFGLARRLKAQGYQARVVPPSQVPREASPSNKTDSLDSRKLARYLATGVLDKFVTIPTRQEEDDRQLVRLRQQFVRKLRQSKQQIKSLLLQYGIDEPEGLKHWSKRARAELLKVKAGSGVHFALRTLLKDVQARERALKELGQRIEKLSLTRRHAKRVKILLSHPGVGPATALTFETEMFKGRNFQDADEVGSFLGLAPRVRNSGDSERRGPILKRGKGYLRSLLVEAAWTWVRTDPRARSRFGQLYHQTGNKQKAIVAMARRLGIHLWKMLEKGEEYKEVPSALPRPAAAAHIR